MREGALKEETILVGTNGTSESSASSPPSLSLPSPFGDREVLRLFRGSVLSRESESESEFDPALRYPPSSDDASALACLIFEAVEGMIDITGWFSASCHFNFLPGFDTMLQVYMEMV